MIEAMRRAYLLALVTISQLALAVEPAKELDTWTNRGSVVRMPVTWEVTRSDFNATGMSSQTESFRETWTLELGPGFDSFLVSPRARVVVTASRIGPSTGSLPSYLILTDQALARLVGVPHARGGDDESTQSTPVREDLVALRLSSVALGSDDEYTIKINPDEFYAITLNFGG